MSALCWLIISPNNILFASHNSVQVQGADNDMFLRHCH